MSKSFKPEVQTDDSGKWYGNALRFATEDEAKRNVEGLMQRWLLVRETRVVPSDDEPNYRFTEQGELIALGPEPYTVNMQGQMFTIRVEMVAALRRYADHHIPVGDFLQAVLANDLMGACERADDENLAALPAFASYLYNHMPRSCWGDRDRYANWIARRKEAVNDDQQQPS